MAKKATGDIDFIKDLVSHRTAKPSTMVFNKPPEGAGLSLDEMLGQTSTPAKNEENQSEPAEEVIADISLELFDDSPYQPRLGYDDQDLQELCGSFLEVGQTTPITVRPMASGRFEIIAGHRRMRSAKLAGWKSIKTRIVILTDQQAEAAALVENEARKDLTDFERAKLYKRALDRGIAKTQAQAARIFGRTQGRISQVMAMLELPDSIQSILCQHPALFGYRAARDILDLIKRHPEEEEVIVQAVMRLLSGASSSSIKEWVSKTLSKKNVLPDKADPVLTFNGSGKLAFKTSINLNRIMVDVKSGDPLETQKWIVELLNSKAKEAPEIQ